jgi:hypothetical protein
MDGAWEEGAHGGNDGSSLDRVASRIGARAGAGWQHDEGGHRSLDRCRVGFSSDVISDIGGAFEDFGDDVADFFDDLF